MFYLSLTLNISFLNSLLMPHFSCCNVVWCHYLLPSHDAPSIALKLAWPKCGQPLKKPPDRLRSIRPTLVGHVYNFDFSTCLIMQEAFWKHEPLLMQAWNSFVDRRCFCFYYCTHTNQLWAVVFQSLIIFELFFLFTRIRPSLHRRVVYIFVLLINYITVLIKYDKMCNSRNFVS